MKILFMGTPKFALVSLERLLEAKHEICGVITQEDKVNKRGKKTEYSLVKKFAIDFNLPLFQPHNFKNESFKDNLTLLDPEVIVVIAYGKILPEYVLNYPRFGSINVHGSILPKYRGAAPIQWSVINGDSKTGVTTMYMTKELDAGDVILTSEIKINPKDTYGILYDKLAVIGAELILKTLQNIESGKVIRTIQNKSKASFAPMITQDIAHINWNSSAKEIINLTRGLNPKPGAWSLYKNQRIKIFSCQLNKIPEFENKTNIPAGQIVGVSKTSFEVINSSKEILSISEIQFPGKNKTSVKDFLNGNKIEIGEILK